VTLGRRARFGNISQIFRIGFRTRGHARNKLSTGNQRRESMNVHPRPHLGVAKISLFGIAAILMFAGIVAWATPTHSAVEAAIGPAPIDPLSLMTNAKNLPSQEELTLKMWPDNGVVRY
jgi:hypothetical protein